MNNNIGLKIKELRKDKSIEIGKRYTGQMLAEEVGISRSYLGDIESGRTTPNELVLSKIADVFGLDIWDIIDQDTNLEIDNTPSKEELSKQKLDSIVKKIDGNSAIKSWVKNTNLKEALHDIIRNNSDEILNELRSNIDCLGEAEVSNFKSINNIDENEYSMEAHVLKSKYISNYYDLILNKILMLINLELNRTNNLTKFNTYKENITNSDLLAAHDKTGNFSKEDYEHDIDIMNNDKLWND